MARYDYPSLERDLMAVLKQLSALPVTKKQLQQADLTLGAWLERLTLHQDYVEHNEFGLAFEGVVDDLIALHLSLPAEVLTLLRSLAVRMQLDASPLDRLLSDARSAITHGKSV